VVGSGEMPSGDQSITVGYQSPTTR